MTDKNDGIGGNFTIPSDSTETEDIPRTYVSKNNSTNIERKVLPSETQNYITQKSDIVNYETDPLTLNDYAENLIIQAFVDTLAKDISSIDFTVLDDDNNVDSEVVEFLDDLHPEDSYSDVIEQTVRDLVTTGNAYWVKHRFKNSDEVAEIVVADSSTMFKQVDDLGYTKGYVQKQGRKRGVTIDSDDVIHFKFSNASDRFYGISPVEFALDEIDIIDELKLKEMRDLVEGGISSIISQTEAHNQDPNSTKEWNEKVKEIEAAQGSRHMNIYTTGKIEKTEIGTNYEELHLIGRYKFHLQSIAAAFKVNPSYVGFDFENTNRATDTSQKDSYKQRGLKVILEQLEQKINKGLVRTEFDESSEFVWDIETDDDDKKVNYYDTLADAVIKLEEAGIDYEIEDSNINIPEQESSGDVSVEDVENAYDAEVLSKLMEIPQDELEAIVDDVRGSSEGSDVEELSSRQKELVNSCDYDCGSFSELLETIENEHETRTDAIKFVQDNVEGKLSQSTYYNWIKQVDIY